MPSDCYRVQLYIVYVYDSSCFPFIVWTNRHTHATERPTHASGYTASVGKYYTCSRLFRHNTDLLREWARKEGMQINAEKTKSMVFGRHAHNVVVKVNGVSLENVDSFKYLGVMLDKELNFAAQVDYAVSKGKRACAKVGYLIDGRKGVNTDIGIELYKSLVCPHLEYAFPAWAIFSDNNMEKRESTQVQCLKRILGAKVHSSSAAVEVICEILPMRFRRRELCSREFMRIVMKEDSH